MEVKSLRKNGHDLKRYLDIDLDLDSLKRLKVKKCYCEKIKNYSRDI